MESAPLTLAHSHAQTASRETHLSNHTSAIREHELAAEAFAKASQGTTDSEALRILKLLEEQHLALSRIIKVRSVQPVVSAVSEEDPTALSDIPAAATAAASTLSPPSSRSSTTRTTSPTAARRHGGRDLSSSIASNLATARGRPAPQQRRGIPSLLEISTQNAGGRVYNLTERATSPRSQNARQSLTGEHAGDGERDPRDGRPKVAGANDEGFERFFSTFGNLFSKISPSLAFASLPLNPQNGSSASEVQQPSSKAAGQASKRTISRVPTSNTVPEIDTDLSTLISGPALRALRDEAGFQLSHESFYVVPPSGGTESYAGILRQRGGLPEDGPQIPGPITGATTEDFGAGENQHKQRSSHHSTGSNDEFVDARESFGPPSPTSARSTVNLKHRRPAVRSAISTFGSKKTGEELEGENAALRQLLDTQSHVIEKQGKRLQMWEAQSQSQTAGLMAQSFMTTRIPGAAHSGRATSAAAARGPAPLSRESSATQQADKTATTPTNSEDTLAKIAALEAKLAEERAARQELEKSERKTKAENVKLQTVVGKYRERWEVLKQGARERQNKKTAGEGTGGADVDSATTIKADENNNTTR